MDIMLFVMRIYGEKQNKNNKKNTDEASGRHL
jgi:hypothetical protein